MSRIRNSIEPLFFRMPYGLMSRLRVLIFRLMGMTLGKRNRFEAGRIRRISQIKMGRLNHFSEGWYLWPEDASYEGHRIVIGDDNYFNRNVMIDACGLIEIGSHNLFGPDIYMTDSNHAFGVGVDPHLQPMQKGQVRIGNYCWIGAKAVILKGVTLGDNCVVAAGAVVTRDVPSGGVVAGVPARVIKTLQ